MDENVERVLDELDGFRMADAMTYAAYSRLHDLISELDDLLKAQEPILLKNQHKPGGHIINANSPWVSRCPKCNKKALLNDLCEDREEGTFVFTDSQAEAADKIIVYVTKRINAQPSVPAVPLDKLCEWLERNAAGRWNGLEYTEAGWKDELTRWMEEHG